jgi:hypothetical protein
MDAILDCINQLPISRDAHGAIAPLTQLAPIGLQNGVHKSVNLFDFLDELCLKGVGILYLTRPLWDLSYDKTSDKPDDAKMRSVRVAARDFNRAVTDLRKMRQGNLKLATRKLFVSFFKEDRKLLKDVHILNGDLLKIQLPGLSRSFGLETDGPSWAR